MRSFRVCLLLIKSHVRKIFSINKILTSIKGYNFVTNKQNMEENNANIYLINIYAFTKFGEILSICHQDIAQKQTLLPNKGHNFVTNL